MATSITTKKWTTTKDGNATLRISDSLALGAGLDHHLMAGLANGYRHRSYIGPETNYPPAGNRLRTAVFRMHITSAHHAKGASAYLRVHRVKDLWHPGTYGGEHNGDPVDEQWYHANALNWDTKPSADLTMVSDPVQVPGSGWIEIHVEELVEATLPNTLLKRDGTPGPGGTFRGLQIQACDSDGNDHDDVGDAAYYSEYSSAEGIDPPEVITTWDNDTPPDLPTNVVPVTNDDGTAAAVASADAKSLTIAFRFVDPDAGDSCGAVRVQVFADGATDASPGTAVKDVSTTPTVVGAVPDYQVVIALAATATGRFRFVTQDQHGAWATNADGTLKWTSLTDGRFKLVTLPPKPTGLYVQTTPDSPHVFATLASGTISRARVVVDTFPGPGLVTNLLDNGEDGETVGGASNRLDYATSLHLDIGTSYRLQVTLWNQDGLATPPSDFYYWTPAIESGPSYMYPSDQTVKLQSRRGPLLVGNLVNFDQRRDWVYRGETLIWDSGPVTVAPVLASGLYGPVSADIPAGKVDWGERDITWVSAIRPAGNAALDPASPARPLAFDALSDAPTLSFDAIRRPDGVWVIPDGNPLVTIPYTSGTDVADFGEAASAVELEVRHAATPAGSGALVVKRTDTAYIQQATRVGHQVAAQTTGTSWTPSVGAVAAVATNPTGYGSTSLQFSPGALAASATATITRALSAAEGALLRQYGGGALIREWLRSSNLTGLQVRVRFEKVGNWQADYALTNPGAINTYLESVGAKSVTAASSGTPWSSDPDQVQIRVTNTNVGSQTFVLLFRSLRIGLTQTAKSTPDGDLAPESTYDMRARERDDAEAKLATTLAAVYAGATNVRLTSVTGSPALVVGDWLTIETAGLVESRQITAIGTAGSGGTGITVDSAYAYAHANADTAKVYPWGAWGPWATVKDSAPPTVALATPTDGATVTNPHPTLSWTFGSTGGKDEAAYVLMAYLRDSDGNDQRIYSSARVASDAGSQELTPGLLTDSDLTIAWDVEVEDEDGLKTLSPRFTFTTSFTAPADVTELVAAADDDAGAVDLTWTPSVDDDVYQQLLYWLSRTGDRVLVAALSNDATGYRWHGTRVGLNTFLLTADNGAIESDGVTVDVTTTQARAGEVQMVVPDDPNLTFGFGAQATPSSEGGAQQVHEPIGGKSVVIKFGPGSRTTTLKFLLPSDGWAYLDRIRQLKAADIAFWLKTDYDDPLWCEVTDLSDDPGPWPARGVTVTCLEVDQA